MRTVKTLIETAAGYLAAAIEPAGTRQRREPSVGCGGTGLRIGLPNPAAAALPMLLILTLSITACGGGGDGGASAVAVPDPTPDPDPEISLVARTGPIVAVRVGETAMLSDNNSYTTSQQLLRFQWSFSHRPEASSAVLQGETSRNPSFVADVKGAYLVQLTVSAGGQVSTRALQQVIASDPSERLTGPFNHQGLSSSCVICHSDTVDLLPGGGMIGGKSATHIAASSNCEGCHTPLGFMAVPYVDHREVFGVCSDCHDGTIAVGKSEFHPATEAECDSCHNTDHFLARLPDGSFDHTGITRACSGCHNGTVARGKTPAPPHPETASECGYCHTVDSFTGAYPDHSGPDVVGKRCDSCHGNGAASSAIGEPPGHPVMNPDCAACHTVSGFSLGGVFHHRIEPLQQPCESCHNDDANSNFGGLALGKGSAVPAHPATTSSCDSCHSTDSFSPAFGIDHTDPAILAARCDSCHGVSASGKSADHLPTLEDCGACHTPGSFATGSFSHDPGYLAPPAQCADCHDNVISVGKLPSHFPTPLGAAQDCADCHDTVAFAGTPFDHAGIDPNNCAQCHNGDYGTTANSLYGKPPTHLPTSQDCSVCHSFSAPFSPALNFAHLGITDNCESCHNGNPAYVAVGALGKKPDHIPAEEQCSNCHVDKTAGGFASSTFLATLHPGISNGCEGCHVSRFFATRPDLTKGASHLPTAQDCDLCHTVAGFGPPTRFAHVDITGDCASCHSGNPDFELLGARGKTPSPPHPATTADCADCHNTVNFADAFVDHSAPAILAVRCDSCHNGIDATGKNAAPGHVTTSEDCSVCHLAGGAFTPAVFDHSGIVDNCASCHNGVDATGTTAKTNPPHIPITQDCSVCHTPTLFANARFEHQGIVDNCAGCHDGFTATGKGTFHVPTSDDCGSCHVTTGFLPARFDHVGIVDNCAACHAAGFATPKSIDHVATTQDCGVCHNTGAFVPATFDHTGIVDNCASCHDGNTATGMADAVPPHLPTSLDCHFCHVTATFVGGGWVHDASTANNCDSCHAAGGGATPKSLGHLNTTEQCDQCHTTTSWAPSSFSHDPGGNYPGDHRRNPGCNACHGTTISSTIPWPFTRYAPFCAACHANSFESEGAHNGGRNGTVEQNKDCSGGGRGCHRVSDSEF